MLRHSSYFLDNRLELILLVLIILSYFSILPNQTDTEVSESKFKIVFVADVRVAANMEWLDNVATDWGATGICLRIFWGHVDTDSNPGADNLANLDKAVQTITENQFNNKKLDIYLRVCMGLQKPKWVSPLSTNFTRDDFQIKYDNSIYNHQDYEKGIPDSEKHPLNFNSPNSQKYMRNFLSEVLTHIDKKYPDSVKSRIKEIVPTFSTSDEQEYPFAVMCGYSSYENEEFINYLKIKYLNSLSSLNDKWNPKNDSKDFDSWSEILPSKYQWHTYDNSEYKYPNGRVDWIYFRTEQLTKFIKSLATICLTKGFKMGAQIGSLYDGGIEKRGWVDPTMLFEKVNSIHTADIYNYAKNFDFAANYVRSICKFWKNTNSNTDCSFTTETNWPGYDGKTAAVLCPLWTEQLREYYINGASALYLVGWDIQTDTLERYTVKDNSDHDYSSWCDTIRSYSGAQVVTTNSNSPYFVHLDCDQVFINHNSPQKITENGLTFYKFELYNSLLAKDNYNTTTSENYGGNKDIITNYMILRNPKYINRYTK